MLKSAYKYKDFSAANLVAHIRTPLYRNGYALLLSGVASSGLGMVYWLLAARYYDTAVVGLNSAILSAMILLSSVSLLSFHSVLIRFVPLAGHATYRLVGYTYLISVVMSAIIGFIFCLGLSSWSPTLQFISARPWFLVLFVFSIMVSCIFTLQDSVLTGVRQMLWIPIENVSFVVLKIVLLLIFTSSYQQYGIFASTVIPIAVSLLPVNFVVFWRFIPKHIQATQDQPSIEPQQIIKYILGNYPSSLFYIASTALLPIIVADQAGARANAYFYQPWMMAGGLQLVALNMTTSLTVEATIDQTRLSVYYYRMLIHLIQLLIPLVTTILLIAPYMLQIFGDSYATEGALLLRLLALSAIPNSIVILYVSLARVQNWASGIVLAQGSLCVLLLSMSYIFLRLFGITGVGVAALMSQTLVAVLLLFTWLRPILLQGRAMYRREQAYRHESNTYLKREGEAINE